MQLEAQNKMMDSGDAANKADMPTTVKAVSLMVSEYFFPGGGVWKPMTVKAPNIQQATEIHVQKRVPVEPETVEPPQQPQPTLPVEPATTVEPTNPETEAKAEDSKPIINE